ncbi:MAG: hypothetical protein ACFFEX_00725 [Candidatus Thorarchaeota archaeon]
MHSRRTLSLTILLLPILLLSTFGGHNIIGQDTERSRLVDIGGGQTIEVQQDEVLQSYSLSDVPLSRDGVGSPLNVSEYGARTDSFTDIELTYETSNTTTSDTTSVPLGPLWEGTAISTYISDLQENRTWLTNPDFATTADWVTGHDDVGDYTNQLTNTISGGYVSFTQSGYWDGSWYRHDLGDRCYAEQSISTNSGEVTWVGVSLDYYVDDDWGGGPVGFWELYVQVGSADIPANHLWDKQFSDVLAQTTWYSTGLIEGDASLITSSDFTLQIGMRTTRTFGCRPQLNGEVRMDNVKVYVKSRVQPSQVNLQMNGLDVANVSDGIGGWLWGIGTASEVPQSPWIANSVNSTFTWTPNPVNPDPNDVIRVTFSVDMTVFARKLDSSSLYKAEVQSYGDYFTVSNNSQVSWNSYYFVAVPNGYSNPYFFNLTKEATRTFDMVSEPRYPDSDFPYWTQDSTSVNVSVYEEVTGIYQNGFWRLQGHSANMIQNLQMWTGSAWDSTFTYRAYDNVRFRAQLSSAFNGAVVSFSIYDTSGALWDRLEATVIGGFAETTDVNLDALTAEVGKWTVQAFANDSVSGGPIHDVGFYGRVFTIQHSTDMYVTYPRQSQITWMSNLTYGQDMLLQVRVNDSDNGDLLPGGSATYNWTSGVNPLNDMGTGEYSVVLNTADLGTPGRYAITLTWSNIYYDSILETFVINVIEETSLSSPDAPGLTVPRSSDAAFELIFADSRDAGIDGATILCNWTDSSYTIVPAAGEPGNYTLTITTPNTDLGTYAVIVTAQKDFYVTASITLFIEVRQLFTSVSTSRSVVYLPIGFQESVSLTVWDTDHDLPITGADSSIVCNWSESHVLGDQNYTVTMTSPGIYEVVFFSTEADFLQSYDVVFDVSRFGYQNHTFSITVIVTSHLTLLSLDNPVEPTPYTGTILINVTYFDASTLSGIIGSDVLIYVTSPVVEPLSYTVYNGSIAGQYIIAVPASQWGDIGWKQLSVYANWTGQRAKYDNKVLTFSVRISGAPTDLFLGTSPTSTPYGENVTFTIIYWDVGATNGIVNGTGPFANNVLIYIEVITPGQTLTQSLMVITEIDFVGSPGEYRIEFNSSYLSGLIECQLRIRVNWTKGALPLYENRTLILSVFSTYRQTVVNWNPLPVTPYDEKVNLTLTFKDVLSDSNILDSPSLEIATPGYAFTIYYDGDATGIFFIEVDTSLFLSTGTHSFQVNLVWSGSPFYQNRTVNIFINVRERYTSLTHGVYSPVEFGNNLTLVFIYTDQDDLTSLGMDGGTLTVMGLAGFYDVADNGDGTYTLELRTDGFPSTGTFIVNVSIAYGGARFSADAVDFFYLTIQARRTQMTSELPDLAPFLTQANITVQYIDDSTDVGIEGAQVYAFCATSSQPLVPDSNYWVDDLGSGYYRVRISTIALGNFGRYTIEITANWTGSPFYLERVRLVDIEVSRRPVSLSVSKSPLNTPFLENVNFELTIADSLDGSPISLNKSVLIITHGGGTLILDSEYSISGANGVYVISINSTVLTSVLVSGHPIFVKFFWGDFTPYYANSTTSTAVEINTRFTQGRVLATPGAFYYFNLSAIIEFSDYLSGNPIPGAMVTFTCVNDSVFSSWIVDMGDGRYTIIVDTNDLEDGIGRYFFSADITWSESPYYEDVIGLAFSVLVNPVSTSLNFVLPQGVTYYLGDLVVGNITFTDINEGQGIDGATVVSDWTALWGTTHTITPLGNGIYRMEIDTSGLNAQIYTFSINASKPLHLSRSVTADILLAAIPVEIDLVFSPTDPVWGDVLEFSANITDARNGAPVLGATVNLTLYGRTYTMAEIGGGIYNATVSTMGLVSGEYTIRVESTLLNYETRQRDFQIRIDKVAANMLASLDPQIAVNGETVTIEADYLILSNGTAIDIGLVTYSWIGGTGFLTWVPAQQKYIGQMIVASAAVGNHQILIQASSSIYKSVSTPITIEITEITTALSAYQDITVLSAVSGDFVNVTVYLENVDLTGPVLGATLTYGIDVIIGDLTELGNGYYTAQVPTGAPLQIGDWVLTVSSVKDGFTPASTQFTITILKVPTAVLPISDVLQNGYYGTNLTFLLSFNDTFNNIGITGALATYVLEGRGGTLVEIGGGVYSLTINTTWVSAGLISHDISVTFQKNLFDYAYSVVKFVSMPISTEVIGSDSATVPVGDDFTQMFQFNDTLNNELLVDASVTAFWEFGSAPLFALGNGSYRFGPTEAGFSRLEVRSEPYALRILFSKANYSTEQLNFELTIREIATTMIFEPLPPSIYVGEPIYVRVTYMDVDHGVPIIGAINTTIGFDNEPDLASVHPNGTYVFVFVPRGVALTELIITLDKEDYQTGVLSFDIYSEFSPETLGLFRTFSYAGLLLILVAGLAAAYVRVWSVPKLLRIIRRMVSLLGKGQIPPAAKVRDRRAYLLHVMNDELEPVGIRKTMQDVAVSTVEVEALDVEQLLEELQVVVGLTHEDISVLRSDLEKMRPSERAGFIGEVIRQERARRARELAEVEVSAEAPEAVSEAERMLTEDELEHLKQELIKMGIEPSEADLMVEQAKSLTKAEIDALLDQIGGLKE